MQTNVDVRASADGAVQHFARPHSADDQVFELGLLLAAVRSFLSIDGAFFGGKARSHKADLARECRLVDAVLFKCSELAFRVRHSAAEECPLAHGELDDIAFIVRDAMILANSIAASGSVSPAQWRALGSALRERFDADVAVQRSIAVSVMLGPRCLPARVERMVQDDSLPFAVRTDLRMVFDRLGTILRALACVGEMLERDAPLKPALVLLAHLHDLIRELIAHLDGHVARLGDDGSEIFGLLDGASYTASLELKKVFGQELDGVIVVRPAPSVYARLETSCSLLTESFQQVLTGFARITDPGVRAVDLFPSLKRKLDHSLKLREHLSGLMRVVRAAEAQPEGENAARVREEIDRFRSQTMGFLYYKDLDTFERFCEEVAAASGSTDIVPLLHTFGAYLETLLGQVNMRAVLANNPSIPAAV